MENRIRKKMWWKEILQKKYLNGSRKRCMEKVNQDRKGSPIWDLCKKATFILNDHLYLILGSGKQKKIWKDNIGPTSLANFLQAFSKLKHRMDHLKIYT